MLPRILFRLALILAIVQVCANLKAQMAQHRIPVYVNDGVFVADTNVAQVVKLYQDYLNSNPDSVYDNPYWNDAEKKRYGIFDLLNDGAPSPSLYIFARGYKPTILSVAQEEDHWRIRTMFAQQVDSSFCSPIAITDVIAKEQSGKLKLFNAITYNTETWQRHKLGSINFVSSPGYHFDRRKAKKLLQFLDSLRAVWKLPEFDVDYYYANRCDEVEQARGLVYFMGYGNADAPSGRADPKNRIVFSGGLGEFFPHEFVHIYINPLYPNAHEYFLEGYATLLGGSHGASLPQLLKNADRYLRGHPEFNIDSLFQKTDPAATLDYVTGTHYAFGGLFCKMAEEKGGLAAIKKLFSYPNTSDGLYQALYDTFAVKKEDVGKWVREKVSEYAEK
jgi:hypothetical protein